MKLWDSLTTCLILLSTVHASPPPPPLRTRRQRPAASAGSTVRTAESPLELPPVATRLSASSSPGRVRAEAGAEDREGPPAGGGTYSMEAPLPKEFEDVVDFIKVTIGRIRRSSSSTPSLPTSSSLTTSHSNLNLNSRTRHRRERKKGASSGTGRGGARREQTGRKFRAGRGSGRGQGCVLKQIHLNVTDLGLGYTSGEEMIFRYCSGPCRKSETNYDKILYNLIHNRKLPSKDTPPHACCRPIAFDDDLSFLDDNLIYHTVRKHSARKCGCV